MVPRFYKRPWIIIGACVLITIILGIQLPHLQLENDIREYLPHKDASYTRLIQTEEEFGSVYIIGVSLETEEPSILTSENISILKNISDKVESIDNVDKVDSLANIDYVCSQDGSLVATALINDELFTYNEETQKEEFIGTEDDIKEIKNKMIGWEDMYDRVIISDDFHASQMQIVLKNKTINDDGVEISVTGKQRTDVLHEVRKIVEDSVKDTNLKYTIYGDPVITDDARTFMLSDLIRLIPLVVFVVLITLFFSFKTLDGTLLPLITVLISTIWSCGLMAIFGIPFTIVSSVIPVALIAVGSAYGIHILTHYYIAIDKIDVPMTKELHAEAIWAGIKEVKVAVFLAGVTTIIGFISLVSSPISPLHSFAIFTSLGVLFSLILAITFIPAILLLKPLNKVGKRSKRMEAVIEKAKDKAAAKLEKVHKFSKNDESGSTFYNIYKFFAGTKPRLILFSILIIVVSIVGLKKLVIDTALINYFPEDSKLRKDVDYVNKRFAGTNSLYMIVSLDKPEESEEISSDSVSETATSEIDDFSNEDFSDFGDFGSDIESSSEDTNVVAEEKSLNMTNPELLKALDGLQDYLDNKYHDIGKIVSFTSFVKRMNQVMNGPDSVQNNNFENNSDFINPNVKYSNELSKQMTFDSCLEMLNSAYVEAGGKDASVKNIVDILERKFNYKGISFYEIPYNVEKYPVASREDLGDLVSQYLMLLGGDTLERFAIPVGSFTPTKLRVQIQLRSHSTDTVGEIIKDAQSYAKKHFPAGYKIDFTGAGELEYVMTNMVISSQLTSLLISLLSVFIIIAISFKSGWAGLLGSIPLAFTIILNYMVMGFAHINLDLVTSIIASVAIGVGIDYTIHFLETFHTERLQSDDMEVVLKNTFNKSGTAIVTNALAVGLGFLVLCLSEFVVLRYIGILIAIVMFSSSALALTIIPGVLNITDPKFMRKK